ncbi:MAG: hypothetical protein GVY06_06695 [Alphaproteobacteria bacterium]|jgi:peptidyl-prolyl cis-trans isomerase D|nr:hypothetical protein [Alphaproteobacteria bacterium]
MLTMMRNFLRSKASLVLFALIIVSMAAWGITDVFSGRLGDNIIQAGQRGLTQQDFDFRVESYLRNQRNQGNIMTRQDAVEQGAVDQLFAVESGRLANLGYAERIGAVASTQAIVEELRGNDAFADPMTGEFSSESYRRILRQNQLTPQRYEDDVRDSLTMDYLSEAVGAALQPPESLKSLQAGYLAESRQAAWFTVSREDIGDIEPPTPEDVAQFYQENQDRFSIDERRAIARLDISPRDFIHQVETSEDDLRAIYESQKRQRFSQPDIRRFVEVVMTSEAAARDALGRLAGGADPDSLSAAEAVNERRAMRSELANDQLAEALFGSGAQPGAVAGPFEQDGLWLVARLEEVTPGAALPFEEVRGQIADEVARNQAESLFGAAEVEVFDLIGAGLTLDEIAEQLGGTVIEFLPVTREGRSGDGLSVRGLASNGELMATAFRLDPGEVSDPVENDEGLSLIEVQDILPPRTPALEEIRDRVRAALVAEREASQFSAWAGDVESRIASGETDLAQEAERVGAELERTEQPISRAGNNSELPRALQARLFAMDEGDTAVVQGPGPTERTVLQLTAINPPDEAEVSVLSGVVAGQLTQSLQSDMLDGLLVEFREATDLRADQGALERYKASITERP